MVRLSTLQKIFIAQIFAALAVGMVAYTEQWYLKILGVVFGALWIVMDISLYRTMKKFAQAVSLLKVESKQAHGTGRQLVKAANSLSSTSSSQAASIEETSASLEEMNSMIDLNAKSSNIAKDLAHQAAEKAIDGSKSMTALIASMSEVSASSKKIEEIMSIIDDIAFQINLLALNASVEAARAGEHGKGFAVVADAVRNLAHKSAESAKEIAVLTQESIERIEKAQALANESGNSVSAIGEHIGKVSQNNNEIASASAEQAQGINQISKAILILEKGTIENSSVASETLQFSKKSLEQAEGLLQVVDVLESEIFGRSQQKQIDTNDMDFDSAVEAHMKWKARLANFVGGMSKEQLKSTVVCKDDQCQLGKWIHGPGSKFSRLQSFGTLKSNHAHFHKAAGAIVAAVEKENHKLAEQLLEEGSDFERYTNLTVESIYKIQEEVAGKKAA
ncbi:MAG: CZB domain-containing protein [Bdellovibrio sp.]|nr:CZB domain-containing protein [Bdellovibrio sp.]